MRRLYIMASIMLLAAAPSTTRDVEPSPDQLDAAARECGNRFVRNAAKVRIASSAQEIYLRCGAAWHRRAIAAIEDRARDRFENFRKRKDAHLLDRFIEGETVRLVLEEEKRLANLARRLPPGPSGGFDHALQSGEARQHYASAYPRFSATTGGDD